MINANEQRIIDVAQGSFEYEGELYTVRPTYLKALKSKLNEKNVDLTTEQATKVIRTIYGNIEQGVKDRYLKKLSEKEEKEVRDSDEVHSLDEIGVTGKEEVKRSSTNKNKNQEVQSEEQKEEAQKVVERDGKTYTIQETPLELSNLEQLRVKETESVYTRTANEQIVRQIQADQVSTLYSMGISWVVCIVALVFYLKVLKHRSKALLAMMGVSLISLVFLAGGILYVFNSRTMNSDTWQNIAVESGYFKECKKMVKEDLQDVLTGVQMNSGVGVLGLDEDKVYRDAKEIFAARLAGQELPDLKKREQDMKEALNAVLPKEPTENINKVTKVLLERYNKILDTPYASYLFDLQNSVKSRIIVVVCICVVLLLPGVLLLWKGTKFHHRKFRALSYGFGVAGVTFIASAIIRMCRGASVQADPESYQILLQSYLQWCSESIFYFGILFLFVALFTWSACYVTKKKHIEKLGLE